MQSHPLLNAPESNMKLGLDALRTAIQTLGVKKTAKVITVAGTNGKGSTVHAAQSLLRKKGFRVGVFISPHLFELNERIQINGTPVSDSLLDAALNQTHRLSLSYFERIFIAALSVFNQQDLDYWILEVGIGGRLDAVNVIDPDIAILTAIDLDHQHILGECRELIGKEKAGIFRNNIPVIIADRDPPRSVLDASENLNCPIFNVEPVKGRLPSASLGAALSLARVLNIRISEADRSALSHLTMAGRYQYAPDQNVIFDVGHNPHAGRYLARRISHDHGKVSALIGMKKDKAAEAFIAALAPAVSAWHFVSLSAPETYSAEELSAIAHKLDLTPCKVYETMALAKTGLLDPEQRRELLLVTGSFLTVAAFAE